MEVLKLEFCYCYSFYLGSISSSKLKAYSSSDFLLHFKCWKEDSTCH